MGASAVKKPSLYTPVERKILAVLADGLPHDLESLQACLADDLASPSAVRFHLSNLRKKLPPPLAILCEIHNRTVHYRQVRLLGT